MTGQPYQVMPPLDDGEYDALKASIAEQGYDQARPVVVDEHGAVLDGHHRQRACADLGITPPVVVLPGLTEDEKHDYAMRANLACRHLSQAQKRDLIHAELDRNQLRSDREIGRLVGVDHKTVGACRRGEIPHPDRPAMTREEAEQRMAEVRRLQVQGTAAAVYYLSHGGPPAMLARQILGQFERFKARSCLDPEVLQLVEDQICTPQVDAILSWPGGAYAAWAGEHDSELRAATAACAPGYSCAEWMAEFMDRFKVPVS